MDSYWVEFYYHTDLLCFSRLCIESACLVKDSDSVWYRAMVVGLLDDHKYEVTFTNSHDVHTVDMEDILPIGV